MWLMRACRTPDNSARCVVGQRQLAIDLDRV
jgi:hypothetical protein